MNTSKKDSGGKYLSPSEAAKELGVTSKTVREWVARKRLPAVQKRVTIVQILIPRSSLKGAFDVVCKLCGKTFRARRRPEKAMFCTADHREEWFRQRRQEEVLKEKEKAQKAK